MLAIAEAVCARLAQVLERQGMPGEVAVRFMCEGQGIALRRGSERARDGPFQYRGRTVSLRDAQVPELLAEHTLDAEGAKLKPQHSKESE